MLQRFVKTPAKKPRVIIGINSSLKRVNADHARTAPERVRNAIEWLLIEIIR
jgi:hypothetical protein